MRRSLLLILACAPLAACGSSTSSSASSASSSSGPGATTTSSSSTSASASGSSEVMGFEGVPIEQGQDLAPPSTTGTATVDGIKCGSTEQLAYHIHAHLRVYVSGVARAIPGGVGIPGSSVVPSSVGPVADGGQCIYWLHTHAPDGVIHLESPTARIYTLANFFDEWHQPLSATNVAGSTGKVTAFVNGKPWHRSPRAIPLDPHAVIQLDVGSPIVPFHGQSWAGTQL